MSKMTIEDESTRVKVKDEGNLRDPLNTTGVILVSMRKEVTNPHFGLRFINRNYMLDNSLHT